ncbi:endo alpha-1,4 polygalactosaminidase [Kineococcus gynurae]|uniref:Endo alpha-1,4 polygalactosaminidase n=1 Tax=Kineococcus gynurae TaxID=452979 RepID=A0ABV5LP00_9ACTN
MRSTTRPRTAPGAGPLALLLLLTACSASGPPDPSEAPGGTTPVPIASTTPVGPTPSPAWWVPEAGTSWQWQLSGPLDLSLDVAVYDVDREVPATVVEQLHERGIRVVCYVSVGTVEDYRDDAAAFPPEVRGEPLPEWPDERWLDVRRWDLVGPPLLRRFDECRDKGFDAVEADNVDAWVNDSGFDLTAEDQLRFVRRLADAAHERGLAFGLKNDLDQVTDLVDDVDFAVVEECARYDECDRLAPLVAAGKAVLHVEYRDGDDRLDDEEFCRLTDPAADPVFTGISSLLKNLDLDAARTTCPGRAGAGRPGG